MKLIPNRPFSIFSFRVVITSQAAVCSTLMNADQECPLSFQITDRRNDCWRSERLWIVYFFPLPFYLLRLYVVFRNRFQMCVRVTDNKKF